MILSNVSVFTPKIESSVISSFSHPFKCRYKYYLVCDSRAYEITLIAPPFCWLIEALDQGNVLFNDVLRCREKRILREMYSASCNDSTSFSTFLRPFGRTSNRWTLPFDLHAYSISRLRTFIASCAILSRWS